MNRGTFLTAFIILAIVVIVGAIYFYSHGAAAPPPTPGTQTGQALPATGASAAVTG